MIKLGLDRGSWFKCTFLNIFVSLILFNTTLFITAINATHFRGGTVWWGPSQIFSEDTPEIQVEYQVGWRTTFRDDIICSDELIKNQTLNAGIGFWQSSEGNIAPAQFVCTGFNGDQDWMTGYHFFFYNVSNGREVIWNQGRCWVGDLYYSGCGWSLSFSVDVGTRSDTKKPNSSPLSNVSPILDMQLGCPYDFRLPLSDPDDDEIVCRFATTELECGEMCQQYPYFDLSQDCVLTFNGGVVASLVAVTIIIEDRPQGGITTNFNGDERTFMTNDALSYIPLQFLVNIFESSHPCNSKPTFVGDTPPQGQEISTVTGATFKLSVFVKASVPTENITEISFLLPVGAEKSDLEKLDDGIYRANISWAPSFEQLDSNILCFTAKESSGLSSDQRCVTVVVGGVSSPCSLNNGGCSDGCVTISEVAYACDCPKNCWYLDSDRRTCIPRVAVECSSDSMEVSLEKCAVDHPNVTLASYAQQIDAIPDNCKAISGSDYYNFSIGFYSCNTQIEETFWEIKYMNSIHLYADTAGDDETVDPDSTITRGAWFRVPVSCTFSRFANSSSSFRPTQRQVDLLDVPGLGSFSFYLEFYTNSSFEHAVGPYNYPLSFTVNSDVYFGVRAVGGTAVMEVFTVDCLALPDGNDDQATASYEMISEGCLLDSTMVQYPTSSPMENHFSIKAFRFRDSFDNGNQPTVVNIQCLVMVCQNQDDLQSRCKQGCITSASNRRKRELNQAVRFKRQSIIVTGDPSATDQNRANPIDDDDDDVQTGIVLNATQSPVQKITSSGTIRILVESNTGSGPDPSPPASLSDSLPIPIFIGVGIGGMIVCVVIVVGIIFLYHHRVVRPRNLVTPEKNSQIPSPYSENKDHRIPYVPMDEDVMEEHPYIAEGSHTGVTYVRDIFVPSYPAQKRDEVDGMTRHFHLDSSTNDYVWARRVMSGSRGNVVRFQACSRDWGMQ